MGGRLVLYESATNEDLLEVIGLGNDGVFRLYPNVVSGGTMEWEDGWEPRRVL